jgi:uncharacterized protein GlcG (DUF336 family)
MLADARAILDRALAHAGELGVPMTIAIVDGGGNLVALQRMDGAGFATPEVAWGKAWTAAGFAVPTAALEGRFGAAIPFSAAVSVATHGRFTPRQGGLPLAGGGGVGASGGTGEQDEDVVRAGIGAGAS